MPLSKKIAKFNKYVTNKFFLLFAARLAPWAVINHKGRHSRQDFRTPVMAFPTDSGFVIALTYGHNVDWVKNLIASDGGIMEHKGEKIPIHNIRVVEYDEHTTLFPKWIHRSLRRIKLEHCLLAEKDDLHE